VCDDDDESERVCVCDDDESVDFVMIVCVCDDESVDFLMILCVCVMMRV